jgi:hypothetical protein
MRLSNVVQKHRRGSAMLPWGNIPHKPLPAQPGQKGDFHCHYRPNRVRTSRRHGNCSNAAIRRRKVLAILKRPQFWDKKVKIAILVLATFIAMC